MKIVSGVVAAALLCSGLTSCGTAVAGRAAPAVPMTAPPTTPPTADSPDQSGAAVSAPQRPRTGDEAAVEAVFRDYHDALLQRDFARACSHDTAETDQHLIRSLEAEGTVTGSCEEALGVIYDSPATAAAADRISRDAEIENIVVDGDRATIEWSYPANGKRRPATNELQRDEEGWLLVDISD